MSITDRVVRAGGSSPLARGLHCVCCLLGDDAGIIPARAGFTRTRAGSSRPGRDHPRSRGVYMMGTSRPNGMHGSSPLARGLHVHHGPRGPGWRIIPARAGFTLRVLPAGGRRRDHPRSRGVYDAAESERMVMCGSSPLARGLLSSSLRAVCGARIIPARAGFTPRPPLARRPQPDHPRSRGVYWRWWSRCGPPLGSSPLARGLLTPPIDNVTVRGIIPARAGFTSIILQKSPRTWDHPRSRGVYPLPYRPALGRPGSSPLARGLLIREYENTHGFGSSPLARGLQPQRLRCRVPGRIIPARAGFTSDGDSSPSGASGSSPLARGLR